MAYSDNCKLAMDARTAVWGGGLPYPRAGADTMEELLWLEDWVWYYPLEPLPQETISQVVVWGEHFRTLEWGETYARYYQSQVKPIHIDCDFRSKIKLYEFQTVMVA